MTLKIYDVRNDETREVTQEDIDRLAAVSQAYGRLRTTMADAHAVLMQQLDLIGQRGKPLADIQAAPGGSEVEE